MNIAFIVPAIVAILYLSSVTDKRKSFMQMMLIAVFGYMLQALLCAIASTQETYVSLKLILIGQILNGIFGGGTLAFISACASFVAVNETPDNDKSLSLKFSIIEASILFGRFAGSILSGVFLAEKTFGMYQRAFIVSLIIFGVIFVYIVVLFRFMSQPAARAVESEDYEIDKAEIYEKRKFSLMVLVIAARKRIELFLQTFMCLFQQRGHNFRKYFFTFLCIYFVITTVAFGAGTIDYLFLIKKPLTLSQKSYGLLRGLITLFRGIALLVVLPLLKKKLQVSDNVLYTFGLASDTLNAVVFSVAPLAKDLIWLSPIVYMFSNYYIVGLRSFISRHVDQKDIGKFFGILSVLEFGALLLGSAIFNQIYKWTIDTVPSTAYISSASFYIVLCLPVLIFFSIRFKKEDDRFKYIEEQASRIDDDWNPAMLD